MQENAQKPPLLQRKQRGVVLLVVLICLALATTLFVLVVKQAAAERNMLRMSESRLQALWLAEAGLERAAGRLAANPEYVGETWTVADDELAADQGAVVRIRVQTVANRPERFSVQVEADYPDASDYCCRQTKQLIVDRKIPRPRTQPPTETTQLSSKGENS
jgi:type II secretory pathway component PulK